MQDKTDPTPKPEDAPMPTPFPDDLADSGDAPHSTPGTKPTPSEGM